MKDNIKRMKSVSQKKKSLRGFHRRHYTSMSDIKSGGFRLHRRGGVMSVRRRRENFTKSLCKTTVAFNHELRTFTLKLQLIGADTETLRCMEATDVVDVIDNRFT